MNPEQPQPPPLPIPVRFSTCDIHPDQTFTSFCASCLRDRLTVLETSTINSNTPSTSAARTAASALKAIFKSSDKNINSNKPSTSYTVLPELRRSKSFSGGKGEGFSGVLVPQRKSCDVRARSSLWALFSQDDGRKVENWGEIEVDSRELGFSGTVEPVEEEGEEEEGEIVEEVVSVNEDELRNPNLNFVERVQEIEEIVEEVVEVEEEEKTMKDHIHIEIDAQNKKPSQGRDLKEIAGSFWVAASVFSKKLQKWRRKQKTKKNKNGGDGDGDGDGDGSSARMQVDKPYSEIADYGYGRRSIDIDPRFSLDAGRMSFDDPRCSWEAPRASWDGYLTGRTLSRVPPPMVSLVEHVPVTVPRVDNQIPVEEPRLSITEDATTPGGSVQTRDYYSSDSSSSQRRRKSFERSNSIRKKAAAVVAELDEPTLVPNAKVTPAILDPFHGSKLVPSVTLDPFHGSKLLGTDRDLKNLKSSSLRDDYSESFESAFRDSASVTGGLERKGSKKSRRWSKAWNIWGLIYRRGGSKEDDEEDRYSRGNGVQRSLSESWPELRRDPNGDPRGALNRVLRSNSSVSSRNSFNMNGSLSNTRRNGTEVEGHGKKKKEIRLERNRSGRYSTTDLDNGMLRFYLTPMRSGRSNGSGKSVPKSSHSIASSVLRMY